MAVIFALIALIARNIVINLAAVGKEFSFGFLMWPAAYDITFSPFIEYTNQSTHLRAATVGALNTLLVAFFGIILASILGFTLGILRLSSNWLVNRIAYVFLEFMRNVPVLIHILALYSLIVVLLPPAKKSIVIADGTFFLSNRGFYVPSPIFESGAGIVGVVLIIAILGVEELAEEDRQVVARARRMQRFLAQPFFVAEQFTGTPGLFVPREETVRSFKEIIEGLHDDLPEQAFYMVGTIDEAVENAKNM